ncbi:hypothetical protein SAMN04489812_1088 [Microlunatus soli]|uniref:Uncharacterized protein n=2 Tax=Microlunatus soli TaxID=630515 RepID=A0A1H1PZV8_9ACTN|nr:hypothetical protein SAMN04489812_1088 [Microlunatus soli]
MLIVIAAVLVVLVVVVISVVAVSRHRAVVGEPTNVPSSTVSGWDDSSPYPSAPPTNSASPSADNSVEPVPSAHPEACDQYVPGSPPDQASDDRVSGGRLSFAKLPADWQGPDPVSRFPFSRGSMYQHQALPEELSWEASAYVGTSTYPEHSDLDRASNQLLQCVATSDFYTSVDVKITENSAKSITIGGKRGVQRDALLRFEHPDLKTTGSRLRIILVQTYPMSYYFQAVPKERTDLIKELDAATASLMVE